MTEKLSDYRKREITGILVPCDISMAMPTKAVTMSIQQWLTTSDIKYFERVQGPNSRVHDFSMVVDDEGCDRGLPWNSRAQFLSGYPIHAPIVGNAIFWSVAMVDEGMDFVNLSGRAQHWLLDLDRAEEYSAWRHSDEVLPYAREYQMRYPQKPPVYPEH